MVGCNLRQKQLQQGEHLNKRCKLWAPTWQKEVGWIPEAGQGAQISVCRQRLCQAKTIGQSPHDIK